METIKFEGNSYPYVLVEIPFGERRISTQTLNEKLMNADGSYASQSTALIDEQIFYFVSDLDISLDSDKLVRLILSEI